MLKLNAFFSIVKLFLNIGLGGRECTYADQITLFVNPNRNTPKSGNTTGIRPIGRN